MGKHNHALNVQVFPFSLCVNDIRNRVKCYILTCLENPSSNDKKVSVKVISGID
jgi:hypothetical protein